MAFVVSVFQSGDGRLTGADESGQLGLYIGYRSQVGVLSVASRLSRRRLQPHPRHSPGATPSTGSDTRHIFPDRPPIRCPHASHSSSLRLSRKQSKGLFFVAYRPPPVPDWERSRYARLPERHAASANGRLKTTSCEDILRGSAEGRRWVARLQPGRPAAPSSR